MNQALGAGGWWKLWACWLTQDSNLQSSHKRRRQQLKQSRFKRVVTALLWDITYRDAGDQPGKHQVLLGTFHTPLMMNPVIVRACWGFTISKCTNVIFMRMTFQRALWSSPSAGFVKLQYEPLTGKWPHFSTFPKALAWQAEYHLHNFVATSQFAVPTYYVSQEWDFAKQRWGVMFCMDSFKAAPCHFSVYPQKD